MTTKSLLQKILKEIPYTDEEDRHARKTQEIGSQEPENKE
jgi:hypothetical protein